MFGMLRCVLAWFLRETANQDEANSKWCSEPTKCEKREPHHSIDVLPTSIMSIVVYRLANAGRFGDPELGPFMGLWRIRSEKPRNQGPKMLRSTRNEHTVTLQMLGPWAKLSRRWGFVFDNSQVREPHKRGPNDVMLQRPLG